MSPPMFDCDADPLGLAVADDGDALALADGDAEALELLELLGLEFEHPARCCDRGGRARRRHQHGCLLRFHEHVFLLVDGFVPSVRRPRNGRVPAGRSCPVLTGRASIMPDAAATIVATHGGESGSFAPMVAIGGWRTRGLALLVITMSSVIRTLIMPGHP